MSSAERRGDLAESMLPVAAHLAVLVHGEGGPEDVQATLAGLSEEQRTALIVVLAGMVDPDQPVGKALGWLDFDENGALTVPASWSEDRSVRDLAPEMDEGLDDDYVDPVAVHKFVKGFRVEVTDAEFLAAFGQCVAAGMSAGDVDQLRGWPRKTAETWLNRLRKRYQRSGRVFPSFAQPADRVFSEAEVLEMRTRGADGDTFLEIALSFNTTATTVSAICGGRRYRQFGGPLRSGRGVAAVKASRDYMCGHGAGSLAAQPGYQPVNAVLTPKERDVVRERSGGGEGATDLAAEYQVSASTIRRYAA